jgi:hypothetical protein
MIDIKLYIKGEVTFQYYFDKQLWYKTENGFEFPVPIDDTAGARFLAKDKATIFMRWIRKWLKVIDDGGNFNK